MFRNPRENQQRPPSSRVAPSTGRAPSPPRPSGAMAATSASKPAATVSKATPTRSKKTQTTLVPSQWAKKSPAANGSKAKPKPTSNGNIMAFFKKAEEQNNRIFLEDRGAKTTIVLDDDDEAEESWPDEVEDSTPQENNDDARYNENGGSFKKRRISDDAKATAIACSPTSADDPGIGPLGPPPANTAGRALSTRKKKGPFVDDSESEADDEIILPRRGTRARYKAHNQTTQPESSKESTPTRVETPIENPPPVLLAETTSQLDAHDFDGFDALVDEDLLEGEEYDERRWMEEQQRLEMVEAGAEGDCEDIDAPLMFPDTAQANGDSEEVAPSCPLCSSSLAGFNEEQVSIHVNACLDGNPLPPPAPKPTVKEDEPATERGSRMFKRPPRPARPGQANPFQLGEASAGPKSAFSKLMSNHAEDTAWASAAASETAARGKPSFQRTCPFYKILPGFYICVDAFRYGSVKGQKAYFLSHFHSDHYIGLTASWCHGPIYCSKVTGNLVRQQLRVDPKWVVDLEFESKTDVPGTEGVHVTMIPANHCPGSSLFLFEKDVGQGKTPKQQRVLHCGDFRACQAHVEHSLLKPEVLDAVSGKNRQQKLDACYLDTTYLNPKYAFPPQQQVIQACADMCVSLNKVRADGTDGWEQMKRDRAGQGMVKFICKDSNAKKEDGDNEDDGEDVDAMKITTPGSVKERGRLLVVVGTYSIGKERICMGIAKALNSKIYAPPNKQKICKALEDSELNALLTKDPRQAQVHMTPLFEIRADTLEDYLRDYRDCFSRAVGFRPSGWNYRPPNSRFTESPSVQTVLHSQNWKSDFSMRDLTPQRGGTNLASCFGVPYSEHSSFRELTMFCCALRIDKIIPTVNIGSAKSREKMKAWCEKWAAEKKKSGLFRLNDDGSGW
ncbi:DNA cross-link repair protein pso2/snm1 [Massariosphaeria phaeospora]|uniref:DNA cross-link repair protein pso2/snm1 n=1 Tax=Massariosphaeria phaeospora TaxID=100035 RepID=A0A7C8MD53_9PLEO|nr:DNA cross-link repair protein pso2/snm1 [Massariosphaeria phaeospora]